jgi:assimilatory nitrate reductase catalytic subunit
MAPVPLAGATSYQAPDDKRAQLVYFRAGHSLDALVYVSLQRDGQVVRLFPLGARSAMHVPLAVIEDIEPGSKLTVLLGAPEGAAGTLVLDIGIVEVE